jgi:hypothetical protein
MKVCRESHLAETVMHLATLRKPIHMVPMFRPVCGMTIIGLSEQNSLTIVIGAFCP